MLTYINEDIELKEFKSGEKVWKIKIGCMCVCI